MEIVEYLQKSGVRYQLSEHVPVYSAQGLAAAEHESGKFVAKPVIVKADGRFVMCVLPANGRIDLEKLRSQLDANSVALANEQDFQGLFPDCELGAEPPFGNLFDLPTVMDRTLERDDHILFQAGTHARAARLRMDDYRDLVHPRVLDLRLQ
jgi:Ala-tRNA(Pro) deacylase